MEEISLREYLTSCSKDEIKECLMKLDASIMALHEIRRLYVVNFDANNIKLYNGELNLSSFNDKVDYLDSGINTNGDKKDILEMCAIGICAYNGFTTFYTNNQFLAYLVSNFDTFSENGNIPEDMLEYYQDVLVNGNIDYLNNYIYKKENANANSSQVSSNGYRLSKTTAIGKAFVDKEAAYVNILLIPALAVLIYLIIVLKLVIIVCIQRIS